MTLVRHPLNPVLSAGMVPFPASLIFNAGVCKYSGRYAMVFRNDFGPVGAEAFAVREASGQRQFDGTNIGLATSKDGFNWCVDAQPCINLETARKMVADHLSPQETPEDVFRFYDPRLTVIDGRVYMCFAVDTRYGLRGGIAVTEDFGNWEVLSLSLPDNRNMVLFPETIGGRFVRLERPMLGYYLRRRPEIWLSRSIDLRDWGQHRLVLPADSVPFCNDKIGPAAPPIRTRAGWLTTFHAAQVRSEATKRGWEASWNKTYVAGLMLLDLDDPSRVIGMSQEPLMIPKESYECEGFRNDVIFPGGMILEPDGEVKVYYGAADTVECVATAHVDDLLRLVTS